MGCGSSTKHVHARPNRAKGSRGGSRPPAAAAAPPAKPKPAPLPFHKGQQVSVRFNGTDEEKGHISKQQQDNPDWKIPEEQWYRAVVREARRSADDDPNKAVYKIEFQHDRWEIRGFGYDWPHRVRGARRHEYLSSAEHMKDGFAKADEVWDSVAKANRPPDKTFKVGDEVSYDYHGIKYVAIVTEADIENQVWSLKFPRMKNEQGWGDGETNVPAESIFPGHELALNDRYNRKNQTAEQRAQEEKESADSAAKQKGSGDKPALLQGRCGKELLSSADGKLCARCDIECNTGVSRCILCGNMASGYPSAVAQVCSYVHSSCVRCGNGSTGGKKPPMMCGTCVRDAKTSVAGGTFCVAK